MNKKKKILNSNFLRNKAHKNFMKYAIANIYIKFLKNDFICENRLKLN